MNEKQLFEKILEEEIMDKEKIYKTVINTAPFEEMKRRKSMKKFSSALVATALVLSVSVTGYAAYNFLTPQQVADKFDHGVGERSITDIFDNESSISINETVVDGGYSVTLLGMASGEDVNEFATVDKEKTYIITAISRENGEPFEQGDFMDLFVSPIINGLEPWLFNAASMNGGYTQQHIDGVMYSISEFDSIEIFSNRPIQLAVLGETFYSIEAFEMDETTGEFTPNESYEGLNVIFDLPVDESKGDEALAQSYIDEIREPSTVDEKTSDTEKKVEQIEKSLTIETVLEKGILLAEQELVPDEEGWAEVKYSFSGEEDAESMYSVNIEDILDNQEERFMQSLNISADGKEFQEGTQCVAIYEQNKDETVSVKVYQVDFIMENGEVEFQ